MKIFQEKKIIDHCRKRQIFDQYQKSCRYINLGLYESVELKLLKPKKKGIYQFRISGKFRGLALKKDGALFVFKISDHQ